MPAINNNSFIPVTTLRQGLINTSTPPDINQGILKLPANTGTTTFPKDPMRNRIHSFNFFIERELPGKFTAQVGYVGTRAVGQMGFIDINASAPGTGNNGRPLFAKFGIFSDIASIQPYATSTYDALQAVFSRRVGSSIFGFTYTFSKAIDYADNDGGPRIQYLPSKNLNRGRAGYDRTHNAQVYWVYDLPFGKGQRFANSGWLSQVVGGFQISGVLTAMSGLPFYVIQGSGFNLNAGGSFQVPDQVNPVVAILGGIGTAAQRGTAGGPYFDTTAYKQVNICTGDASGNPTPACPVVLPQRFGNAGRNNLRGPGFFETDWSIYRTFLITERVRFQFRAEALNATNHANFANPSSDINSSTFGFITGTTGPNQSRQWRFGTRVSF
jgi:hypothetical protein